MTADEVLVVSAPGKMMVSGEYAVLSGAPAIVAAVDRRAYARVGDQVDQLNLGRFSTGPEAEAAFGIARKRLGVSGGQLRLALDVSGMRQGASKLGLGSSAAGAVAAAGLAYAVAGRDVGSTQVRAELLEVALDGHRAVAPSGSGADVAASVHGGFVHVRRTGDTLDARPIVWPRQLVGRVVWTGSEARTSDFVARVQALREVNPGRFSASMGKLHDEAERFVAAVEAGDAAAVVERTREYGRAMAELGRAAGVDIVTDTLAALAQLADEAGGAAKPSGAGGGDVALAWFAQPAAAARFDRGCRAQGFSLLSIKLGAPGVRIEPQRSEAA